MGWRCCCNGRPRHATQTVIADEAAFAAAIMFIGTHGRAPRNRRARQKLMTSPQAVLFGLLTCCSGAMMFWFLTRSMVTDSILSAANSSMAARLPASRQPSLLSDQFAHCGRRVRAASRNHRRPRGEERRCSRLLARSTSWISTICITDSKCPSSCRTMRRAIARASCIGKWPTAMPHRSPRPAVQALRTGWPRPTGQPIEPGDEPRHERAGRARSLPGRRGRSVCCRTASGRRSAPGMHERRRGDLVRAFSKKLIRGCARHNSGRRAALYPCTPPLRPTGDCE